MNERARTDAIIDENVNTNAGTIGTDAERASLIVANLGKGLATAEEVFAAFEELDGLPADLVLEALSKWTGPAPDLERLDPALRRVHGLPPRPLRLRTVAVVKDADVLDLGVVAEEQLRVAGKSWDGVDLAPEERLDGERGDSFAGTLEHRTIVDAETSEPLFDVLLFAGDSGLVFRSGTTDQLGAIAYGKVEMAERRARQALEHALRTSRIAPADSTEPEPEPAKPEALAAATPAKVAASAPRARASSAAKASAKRATAKKASVHEASATGASTGSASTQAADAEAANAESASPKTPGAKAAGVKAPGTKKVSAKTAGAKEAAATKASPKTAGAKAPGAKKASGRSASAKAAGAEKADAKKASAKKASAGSASAKATGVKAAGAKRPAAKKANPKEPGVAASATKAAAKTSGAAKTRAASRPSKR